MSSHIRHPSTTLPFPQTISDAEIINAAFIAVDACNGSPIRINDVYEALGFNRKGREWDGRTKTVSYQRIGVVLKRAGFVSVGEPHTNGGKRARLAYSGKESHALKGGMA